MGRLHFCPAIGSLTRIGISEAAAQTQLAVESSVPACDITVDGNFMSQTPSTLTLPPGQHKVTVSKKGYTDWTRQLTAVGRVHLAERDAAT